jgi:hypothetical protein
MSTSNIDDIRSGYAAFERGDLQGMFAILDSEAEFSQSDGPPWGGRYRGHTQIGEFYRKLSTSVESKVIAERFVEARDQIVSDRPYAGQSPSDRKGVRWPRSPRVDLAARQDRSLRGVPRSCDVAVRAELSHRGTNRAPTAVTEGARE